MSVLPKLEKQRHRDLWPACLAKLASSGSLRDSVSKCEVQNNQGTHTMMSSGLPTWAHTSMWARTHMHTRIRTYARMHVCTHTHATHTRRTNCFFLSNSFSHAPYQSYRFLRKNKIGPVDITVWSVGAHLSRFKSSIDYLICHLSLVQMLPAYLLCVMLRVTRHKRGRCWDLPNHWRQ